MKTTYLKILMISPLLAFGCAVSPRVTTLDQVGPGPVVGAAPRNAGEGSLVVYSAREQAPIDLNREVFYWNDDLGVENNFGMNGFVLGVAHTRYSILTPDGQMVQKVRNSTGINDPVPAVVQLPAGVYNVKADAEDRNDYTLSVLVPVSIQPGRTTVVHLDVSNWNPADPSRQNELVRLPDGCVAGWRSSRPSNERNTANNN